MSKNILRLFPKTILGYPISEDLQVFLLFLLPNCLSCLLYILETSVDIVLCGLHLFNGNYQYALITGLLIWLPVLINFIITISTPEFWPENKCTDFTKWFIFLLLKSVFFPIWAVISFAEKIFWSIEAYRVEGEERIFCLKNSTKTKAIELYFFFQAYFQAVPQVLIQLYYILTKFHMGDSELANIQMYSIFISLCTIAAKNVRYQNYESQKLLGMQYPWGKQRGDYVFVDNPKIDIQAVLNQKQNESDNSSRTIYEEMRPKHSFGYYMESTKSNLSKIVNPITNGLKYNPEKLELPKRKFPQAGRIQEDIVNRSILFFMWFTFTLTRLLSISVLLKFFPSGVYYTLTFHFFLMAFMFIYCTRTKNINRMVIYLMLSFVYLVSLIEFRIRFKRFTRMFIFFFVLCQTENLFFTFVWYLEDWESWWLGYIFQMIIVNMCLSTCFAFLYLKMLKQSKISLYLDDSK